jgi:cobalamin synthase
LYNSASRIHQCQLEEYTLDLLWRTSARRGLQDLGTNFLGWIAMGSPASILLLLRLLLSRHKSNEEHASIIVKTLQGSGTVRAKVVAVLRAVLLEVAAAMIALLLLMLFVAFFYLYCLPWLTR